MVTNNKISRNNYLLSLLFIVGFGLFAFTRTSTFIPIAIFIAPIFILLFLRKQRPLKGILLTLLGFTASITIALWGLFSFEDGIFSLIFNVLRSLTLAIVLMLPYIANRLIQGRVKGFLTTLVFPISATAIYFLLSIEGPFVGTSVYFAYAQYENLTLIQLASITGLWGFVFLISWFASVITWAWEKEFKWDEIKKGSVIFIGIVSVILVFGGVNISTLTHNDADTVRIAAVTMLPDEKEETVSMERAWEERIYSPFNETISRIENLTKEASSSGAKIVVFQEYSMLINENDEEKLIGESKRLAKENNIYFSITYGTLPKEGKGENKSLFINNNGDIEANYLKYKVIVPVEPMKKGPAEIPVVNTPYGKIGITICRDMEFPPYIRQAGRENVDIMLFPSYEFPKSVTRSNTLRAIENGFSMVRPVKDGMSFAVDYRGRVLSSMDYFTTSKGIMYADVPTKGIRTVYAFVGDWFAWLTVLGFVGFIVVGIREKRKK